TGGQAVAGGPAGGLSFIHLSVQFKELYARVRVESLHLTKTGQSPINTRTRTFTQLESGRILTTNWNRGCGFCRLPLAVASHPDHCGSWKRGLATRAWGLTFAAAYISILFFAVAASAQWKPLNPVIAVEKQAGGAKFVLQSGTLQIQVCSNTVIHVRLSPPLPVAAAENLVIVKEKWAPVKWAFGSTDDAVTLTTAQIRVTVARKDSSITFSDLSDRKLFQQSEASLTP